MDESSELLRGKRQDEGNVTTRLTPRRASKSPSMTFDLPTPLDSPISQPQYHITYPYTFDVRQHQGPNDPATGNGRATR